MEQLVGKKLGNYEIVELIGKGGMATVYKGHQSSMNRYVAVKVMSQQYSEDEVFVKRFQNEAQLIAQLEHAHILPVYEFGEHEGLLYIVMRYLPTGTLEDRIVEGGMPTKDAVNIFKQIASALNYSHTKDVIHRDLKPANILIDAQGNAFLSDFGIAKSLEGGQNLTGTGSVVGTPTYMSPEQGLGEDIDSRTDIYALGVMLFEMLTGVVPFHADNPMAVMLKHINEPPPRVRELRPPVHEEIENVVLAALAKDPSERFQTCQEMIDALDYAASIARGEAPVQPRSVAATAAAAAAASNMAATIPSPVSGLPQAATAAGVAEKAVPSPQAAALAAIDDIKVELNLFSTMLRDKEWIGTWLQALGLSFATFLILFRLTPGSVVEAGLLSLVPGIFLYGLLRAPMVGGLISMALIAVPLAAHSPGLTLLWLLAMVIAGARLSSREIMIVLLTLATAGSPFGWFVPLLLPWWMRARRVAFPAAFGVLFAILFATTLGWAKAGGLLPAPQLNSAALDTIIVNDFNTSYLELLDDSSTWAIYTNPRAVLENILSTRDVISGAFTRTRGLPLVIATVWAVAATLTISNRRVKSAVLRASGLGLAFVFMLGMHLIYRTGGLGDVRAIAIIFVFLSAVLAFLFSQWPFQADPARGSNSATNLRLLRQALGAFYMSLGVAYFVTNPADTPTFFILWLGGTFGVLATIANPLIGPPVVFASFTAALMPSAEHRTTAIILAVLLFVYIIVAFFFDKRRPRRWNPLGAGMILGGPGMAQAGIFPLGVLSLGALEAQVPAAVLALVSHVLMIAVVGGDALSFITQIITTLAGVLVVERLMSATLLDNLDQKLRRLIYTVSAAILMALSYYTIGKVAPNRSLLLAVALSAASAAILVAAMGNRAIFWREFIEREVTQEAEDDTLDGDVTGPWARFQRND